MRQTTLYLYEQIRACYDSGRREPKIVADKLNISVDVVYKALRRVFHMEHSSTDTRRKIQSNNPNKSK